MAEEKRQRGRLILVTGGARSGKSAFAERLVAGQNGRTAYIATAQVLDSEMEYRVRLHRRRRPADWKTWEAPFDAHEALLEAGSCSDVILFDCITLYLSNMLCAQDAAALADEDKLYEMVHEKVGRLIKAADLLRRSGATTVFVTNEVGAGIVPENRLSRLYRDLSGLANQQIAAAADQVYAVIAGIPVEIKALADARDYLPGIAR